MLLFMVRCKLSRALVLVDDNIYEHAGTVSTHAYFLRVYT